jgi:hypothetical protein
MNAKAHILYQAALGPISVGALSQEVISEIFRSGRINYRLIEADIARRFPEMKDMGGLGKIDFEDPTLGTVEAKSYRFDQVYSHPEDARIWSARSGAFDKRNRLSREELEEYCVKYCDTFDHFAYYDISQIGKSSINPYSVVFIPSQIVRPYLLASLDLSKSRWGQIPFAVIRDNTYTREVLT